MDIWGKSDFINGLIMDGINAQIKQRWTWVAASIIVAHQTLTKKNISAGLASGLITVTVLVAANGLYNIKENFDGVKETFYG